MRYVIQYDRLKDRGKPIFKAARVLREGGTFVLCSVNKDWEDFHPSPYRYRYFSVPELCDLMTKNFREVKLYGGIHVDNRGPKGEILSLIKRSAVRLNLISGSVKARTYLKRIFMESFFICRTKFTKAWPPTPPC